MGTDITFVVERWLGTRWQRAEELELDADGMGRCERCRTGIVTDGVEWVHDAPTASRFCPPDGHTNLGVPRRQVWYRARDYSLFGFLGHLEVHPESHVEFVDQEWSDRVTFDPIRLPRGLPEDASFDTRYENEGAGGLGLSYLTVGDILGYDWNQHTQHLTYARYRPSDKEPPGRRSLESLVIGEQERLAIVGGPPGYPFEPVDSPIDPPADAVPLSWSEPLSKNLNPLFIGAILRMAHLAGGDLDSVRCVYWFDQ